MKKTIILTLALVSAAFGASAQADRNTISVDRSQIEVRGENVTIDLDLSIGNRVARRGRTVVCRPQITDGTSRWTLPELVIRQTGGRIAEDRRAWSSGQSVVWDEPVFARNGEKVRYNALVPGQPWMDGARLIIEAIDLGCGGAVSRNPILVADNLVLTDTSSEIATKPDVPAMTTATTGEQLAREHKFVLPASEFDRHLPQVMFDDDRRDALAVYFDVGSAVLEPFRNGNSATLRTLLASIRKIQESSDSRVAHIVVAGFASPEGSFELNDRLAAGRASALKQYIERNTRIAPGAVHVYNGAEDWIGLRQMVEESHIPNRQRVMEIIDLVPILDSDNGRDREAALIAIDGGITYRYLLRNFFPELRKAAYIKVFYENK